MIRALLTYFVVLVSLCACERRDIKPEANSRRVVALSPAVAIIVRDLGREDEVVGRHGFDLVLKPALPVCGDQTGINYERLLALNPTHVITEWGMGGPPTQLRELCAERGWRLHDSSLRTPDDILREVRELASFIDADAERTNALCARMDQAWSRDETLASAGRVLLLADVVQPAALGPGSFHHEILTRIGAMPAIVDGGPYQGLTLERIATIDPDVIALVLPRAPDDPPSTAIGEELVRALGRIGELDLHCIRERRIVLIDDPGSLTPSTAMADFAERIKASLHSMK